MGLSFFPLSPLPSLSSPVESIEHLYSDQHRQCHGHGVEVIKDLAAHIGKVRIVCRAREMVALRVGGREGEREGGREDSSDEIGKKM